MFSLNAYFILSAILDLQDSWINEMVENLICYEAYLLAANTYFFSHRLIVHILCIS